VTMSDLPHHKPDSHSPNFFKPLVTDITHIARFNKGTAFTFEERKRYKLLGLLPPQVETLEQQATRALAQLRAFDTNIEKYIYMNSLQERNETVFYRLLIDNLEECMPIVYTPTVGEGCVKYGSNWRNPQGLYISINDKEYINEILDNWPSSDVQIIVVTDGSRILGLGDLGANGMGIPVGKLSLYVAGSGFAPSGTLPITLDLGTNNKDLVQAPDYLGLRQSRIGGQEYLEFLDLFMEAATKKWPNALVQFEDFSNNHAFELLDRYREKYFCFNDDIQGTGAVVLSGFINCLRLAKLDSKDMRLVFYGAGSAGIGVANIIVQWISLKSGRSQEDIRKQFWFVDSKGLITQNRGDKLTDQKIPFARTDNGDTQITELLEIVKHVKPHVLIGLSGVGGSFKEEVVSLLTEYSEKPIVMALSNPTNNAECTAEQAYTWTKGTAIFASGSPFKPVNYEGKLLIPGQGNNMFIFPGLGFGSYLCRAKKVSDGMIIAAANVLAEYVSDERISQGDIYPSIKDIRAISSQIAARVMTVAKEEGLSDIELPDNLVDWVSQVMYEPQYV